DCRISCNAASHATEAAARFVRRVENGFADSAPPRSADCDSRPLGRRANKRRVVSFLQRLGGRAFWALGSRAGRNNCVRSQAMINDVRQTERRTSRSNLQALRSSWTAKPHE